MEEIEETKPEERTAESTHEPDAEARAAAE
jgi:hypothetical protein